MTPLQIAGSALVLVGVVVISLKPTRGERRETRGGRKPRDAWREARGEAYSDEEIFRLSPCT